MLSRRGGVEHRHRLEAYAPLPVAIANKQTSTSIRVAPHRYPNTLAASNACRFKDMTRARSLLTRSAAGHRSIGFQPVKPHPGLSFEYVGLQ
jgi:hypothetical protein